MCELEKRVAQLEKENADLKQQLENRQKVQVNSFDRTFHSTFGDKILFSRIVLQNIPDGLEKTKDLSKEDIETYFSMLGKVIPVLLSKNPA